MTLYRRHVKPLLVATCLVATWSVWPTAQTAEERVEELRSQADQGHAFAQVELGNMYYRSAALGLSQSSWEVIQQDYTEAGRWFRLAADQGHDEAQYRIGVL